MTSSHNPALILIDIQVGLDEINYYGGQRNNPDAEVNARKLLDYWRANKLPVLHVKHNSTNPDSPLAKGKPGNAIKDIVKPMDGEPLFEKCVNSAFIGTDLKDRLDAMQINTLVIAGLTTEHCISTSARMAGNLGYNTYVVSDATAAFKKIGPDGTAFPAELIHQASLATIDREFATVLTCDELIKKLTE